MIGWAVAVLVAVPNEDDNAFKNRLVNFLNERTSKCTFFGNYKPRSDLPSVVEKYMNKELDVEKFIAHKVSFSEINKTFDYVHAERAVYPVRHPHGRLDSRVLPSRDLSSIEGFFCVNI
ncbi:Alcohol dehydrogenase superfamily, zinc-type [Parasponia andersonii]|uniref:Alcohol dehydrogenase superfamily, zinc-type n=1 Tax=Parasponia andersonii TaxID=3476 RepID=A0A2P5DMH6_PARAD|nr:Alcohol dehydrogenase superfamily, zinc-type [Parasponia andersonii]